MDALEERTMVVSRGLTYRYYVSRCATTSSSEPPLLLHHGFPDTAHLWSPVLPWLAALPNRCIIPDLLGFGGTSKPVDARMYAYHLMEQDLVEILDAEGVDKVVSIGHDHGSGSAARFYNHAPDRTAGLILLNVGYQPPNKEEEFDLDAVNAYATKAFGYPIFEYWNFLTAPDASVVLEDNLERLWDCAHAGTFEAKRNRYCVPGAMREYLTNHSIPRIETKPYASDAKLKKRWMAQFRDGGLRGPLCWYTSRTRNIQYNSDQKIRDSHVKVTVPTLFIGCDEDVVCRMEMINGPRDAGLLPDLTIETMKGMGHWPMYERPEQTAEIITRFLKHKHFTTGSETG